MTARTFDELFEPQLRLSLHATPSGTYAITDQHGNLYSFGEPSLTFCIQFMQAMAEKKDAVIDDASVAAATWEFAQQHSVDANLANVIPIRRPA
jgi:hypothetical protein